MDRSWRRISWSPRCQVAEARAAGADAVLAMMSVLDDAEAAAVMAAARALGMDVLVEVHDEAELARGLALGATMIGINNRNLRTLEIDLATTERLAPRIPADVLVVGESGIVSRRDVERLAAMVDGFLVGSSLMRAGDIAQAARSLVHGPGQDLRAHSGRGCGARGARGATHAGFIFVTRQPAPRLP